MSILGRPNMTQFANVSAIGGLAGDINEFNNLLRKRANMTPGDRSVEGVIKEAIASIEELFKFSSAGLIDDEAFKAKYIDIRSQLLQSVSDINQAAGSLLATRIGNLSAAAAYQYLQAVKTGFMSTAENEMERNMNRLIKLDVYEEEIRNYIEQSRRLIDNLPIKLRTIVNKMKDEQTLKYARLKELGKKKVIINDIAPLDYKAVQGMDNLPHLRKPGGNAVYQPTSYTYFITVGYPRAFYCKLPAFLSGVQHDIVYGRITLRTVDGFADNVNDAVVIKLEKMYMHVKNLGKRVYNFKYKAWWGPMVKILDDSQSDDFKRDKCRVGVILRVADCSPILAEKIVASSPFTLYSLGSREAYIDYCKQLMEVRTYNFKVKRTVQRFLRNKMAKFLNTDKQMIAEIGDYVNVKVPK